MKKLFAFLLAILILITFCGCEKQPGTTSGETVDPEKKIGTVSLVYCAGDTLNPYHAQTETNRMLAKLLYDPLFKVNESFEPIRYLAQSFEEQSDQITVHLRDALFTDGSPVTADDVVYSASLANVSNGYPLDGLTFSAADARTVTVSFTPRKNAVNLLTFPIIKKGSEGKIDFRNYELPPIGCGAYVADLNSEVLLAVETYYGGTAALSTIRLLNAPDNDALSYAIKSGTVSLWLSDSESEHADAVKGGAKALATNALIYLGVNRNHPILALPEMRYALFSGLNAQTICETVYQDYAQPASGIYHPNWEPAVEFQTAADYGDTNIYLANLKEIGYNEKDANGYYVSGGKRLGFSLLYCSDIAIRQRTAEELAANYAKIGLQLTLTGLPLEEYTAALNTGNFELYLGEMVIKNDLSIDAIVNESYGSALENSEETHDAVTETITDFKTILSDYNAGQTELYNVINRFHFEMPVIPICYRCDILSSSETLTEYLSNIIGDPYDCLIHIQ